MNFDQIRNHQLATYQATLGDQQEPEGWDETCEPYLHLDNLKTLIDAELVEFDSQVYDANEPRIMTESGDEIIWSLGCYWITGNESPFTLLSIYNHYNQKSNAV